MKLPISVYTAVTVQDLAVLGSPTDITSVAIGTSPNRARITDTSLHRPVASYPAYAMIEHGQLIIYTAMEYGNSLGVYEIGIYAGDTLVATINQKSRYEINKPIFGLRHDRTYIFDIRLDLGKIDGVRNRGALELIIDERDDITYPMAMAIQHNAALTMVATEQVRINQEMSELIAITEENTEALKDHQARLEALESIANTHQTAINELKSLMEANDIARLGKELAERALQRTDELQGEVEALHIKADEAMMEAKNKVRLKSKHERLLIMHDVENNRYDLTLSDVARASNLAAEIIRRQHENARIREEIEEKIEGKLDERQVRAMIAEAELDDVSRDEIKLKIIEAVADKMTDERVSELLSHKMDVLTAERLLADKASQGYVNEQVSTLANDTALRLDAKVDDDAFAAFMQDYAQQMDKKRLELEGKIGKVNDKAIHNHLLIDDLVKTQTLNTQKIAQLEVGNTQLANLHSLSEHLTISRDERAVSLNLTNVASHDDMVLVKSGIHRLDERLGELPEVMNRIAKAHLDTLTDGASGAMDTFAEVEAALNNGDSVAAGILNRINELQRILDKALDDEAGHRQFTGYKTATNLTQIVEMILD